MASSDKQPQATAPLRQGMFSTGTLFGTTHGEAELFTRIPTSRLPFEMLCQIKATESFTGDPSGILFPFYGKLPAALQLFPLSLLVIIIFPMMLRALTTIGREKLRTLQLVTALQLTM